MSEEEAFDVERFIYVKLPASLQPLERGELFEDPIDDELQAQGLGHVSGGGSLLAAPEPDGTRRIEFCGLDIEVEDRDKALDLLRAALVRLEAPERTELHYTAEGQRLLDQLVRGTWQVGLPRTFLHPGFDV
ncbi:hypothetical protein ACFFGH_34240 [Lysobacter korlensis]|uniref:Uncharacterized protein n=1 Tax=Lysobacter korlensis TaxID=553636 RepID=A0ABV6S100_9GAMM